MIKTFYIETRPLTKYIGGYVKKSMLENTKQAVLVNKIRYALKNYFIEPITKPIRLKLVFLFKRPKIYQFEYAPINRFALLNLEATILEALIGVAIKNKFLIFEKEVCKGFIFDDDNIFNREGILIGIDTNGLSGLQVDLEDMKEKQKIIKIKLDV